MSTRRSHHLSPGVKKASTREGRWECSRQKGRLFRIAQVLGSTHGAPVAWEAMVGRDERPVLARCESLRAPALATRRLVFGRADTREPDIALRGKLIEFLMWTVRRHPLCVRPAPCMFPPRFEQFFRAAKAPCCAVLMSPLIPCRCRNTADGRGAGCMPGVGRLEGRAELGRGFIVRVIADLHLLVVVVAASAGPPPGGVPVVTLLLPLLVLLGDVRQVDVIADVVADIIADAVDVIVLQPLRPRPPPGAARRRRLARLQLEPPAPAKTAAAVSSHLGR